MNAVKPPRKVGLTNQYVFEIAKEYRQSLKQHKLVVLLRGGVECNAESECRGRQVWGDVEQGDCVLIDLAVNVTDSKCQPGTELKQIQRSVSYTDTDASATTAQCTLCDSNKYGISGECFECPSGADCLHGSTGFDIAATAGNWRGQPYYK